MDSLPLLRGPAKPSIAGMRDYYLGGTNCSVADREAAMEVQNAMPDMFNIIQEDCSFLRRCVRYMLLLGIKQFVVIDSGFLYGSSAHELAHLVNPIANVVYVGRDLAVFKQGSTLLAGNGTSTIICADIRQPQDVLKHPDLVRFIDFSKPVGVLMMRVVAHFTNPEITHIMSTLRSAICDGSYIAVTHDTLDGHEAEKEKATKVQEIYDKISIPFSFRSHKEVSSIFDGLHLDQPGVVFLDEWHIELMDLPPPVKVKRCYGGVARKDSPASTLATNPQIFIDLMMQLRKSLNSTTVFTSLFVIISCFVTMLAQSVTDIGTTSFQQLKDMGLDWDGNGVKY